ncbi:MAG: CRISPR-associated RecB family exonuclease Cas4 [Rhodobacteraceae bacterium HLUCCA12]|nr:MAG: CRISPR-associated RecB family exonuclease Cas4 [Rhodobacteraceae bacterium HLUCCA12]
MSVSDDIPLSALQHWLFCPRQYALIHIERLWAENRFTAEGRVLHERADAGRSETRPGIRTLRGVEIRSERHGLSGVADVVELRGGRPFPVEYKRGQLKSHRADEVQLCAQALCLEEMFACDIREGALFYGKRRRREIVQMDADLRALTLDTAQAVRACRASGELPRPAYDPVRCDRCSLYDACRPRLGARRSGVAAWLGRAITAEVTPE